MGTCRIIIKKWLAIMSIQSDIYTQQKEQKARNLR
nr:MAG TPA: hypothetical protein [Caudoviricetes sp.]